MAEGRDTGPRSPGWLNAVIWTTGLGAAACFVWRLIADEGEPALMPLSLATVLPRLLACVLPPLLLVVTALNQAVRRVVEH